MAKIVRNERNDPAYGGKWLQNWKLPRPLRKDPAGNSRPLDTACFSIELPSIRDAPKFREEGPFRLRLDYFVTLDFVEGCPLFELFGHKRVSARSGIRPDSPVL